MNTVVPDLVSTIIPVHNRPEMLRIAVESVVRQTYRPIEIVITDDGSTDDTPQVVDSLQRQHSELVTWTRIENSGPGPAREAGRLLARGEFIQYLDSDDRLLPEKFQRQVAALRDHPECGIAYGRTRLVDAAGRLLASPYKWTGRDIRHLFPGLLVDRWWCTHTPLYRRSLCDAIGPWSDMRWSQDWEYDARAGAFGVQLVSCQADVSEHVQHDGVRQTSAADWKTDPIRLQNRVQLLSALWRCAANAGMPEASPERLHFSRWAFAIARQCAATGLESEMRECSRLASAAAGENKRARRGVELFLRAAAMVGPVAAGRAANVFETLRSRPGRWTLSQSFASQHRAG